MALDPEVFRPMIRNVARSVSGKFPPYITAEDTEQALYLWLYEKRATVLATVEDSPDDWEAKIASTMRKVAFDYCAKEKASTEGYDVADLYRYSLQKIKSLLEDVFHYADWQSFGQQGDGQPRSRGLANQTGDRIAELTDVRAAVERLPHDTKELLYYQHVMHYSIENLADHFGIGVEAAKKRAQRAVGAVQKELGRKPYEEQPRGAERRSVVSNAAARARQSSYYEG
jgi:DNA-directed RNA polymerase specialized sigma24 family protein